ncbi:MAG: S26 family signal peptidase [Candidatus Kerfeldbacteria bacterium CG15_BIG_FIL_POST_REV_8_21_14_020_45_12]|uniref:S26 family signal peptidase n=1 Tax=Candidatus Kerfeldbacteria bacterium CG15_BIG_FIL_POST_REV_8_21_14_020_45_12 TaxID=2014247 RepID=A0A2M7H4Z4_9BACT|nr:MAG: S26 family signal peptidase [Candidatus Kerfeldbacteria bacterium CG15_BIG_FIL_POST_REV_8_21_14_020_45_12]PJA93681.1 MAG: S26 family signal peptidase [Candidatus Kerfeldbacteria bacterium CG_4_9_14_3_um_filter_45_8]
MGPGEQKIERADFGFSVREALLWALRKRQRFSIAGLSMEPLLSAGEDVLIRPYSAGERPHAGDVVVLKHPAKELHLIKIIHRISAEEIELRGFNAEHSTDSRDFGNVDEAKLLGRLTVILG